jgi:hypothetical protein
LIKYSFQVVIDSIINQSPCFKEAEKSLIKDILASHKNQKLSKFLCHVQILDFLSQIYCGSTLSSFLSKKCLEICFCKTSEGTS